MSHTTCAHRVYKMTCEDYDELISAASGRCTRCGEPCDRLLLDHDHTIGRWAVRGLVCHRCNCTLRDVDSGRRPADQQSVRFLNSAWHLGRQPPAATRNHKPGRPRPDPTTLPIGQYVGTHGIATMLGVSRQRVTQLAARADFPKPTVVLAAGKVWHTDEIRAWAHATGRTLTDDD